ncbi:two-component sensor histidine kinase [Streptomyces tuirus]|uniref:histidine kinase n=1 Tax=Streptomyces tuirus TaxID=68278 RepID=A0A941FKP0_9ACTN|nr:two-component sensor histidine kinase [Streptomyces tuirus]
MGRLLSTQRRLRRVDRRHPWLLDSLVVTGTAAAALLHALLGNDTGPFAAARARADLPPALLIAITVGMVVPLWWRRRAPEMVFAVLAVAAVLPWALDLWLLAALCLLSALHNLALHGPLRRLGWAAAVTLAEMCVAVFFLLPSEQPVLGLLLLVSQGIAAIALGLALRTRRVHLAGLEDRARRLEVERDQRERLIAAAERQRVAREMHDIVGHNLSVVVGLADGAAVLAASEGEESAEALRLIGDTGRQALGELRRVLGVLGNAPDAAASLSPQPTLTDLDPLLARVRAAGVGVSYRTDGDLTALGSGVQLTVYRIVQEALTNTLKHAGTGARTEVTVAVDGDVIRVRITDTGPPSGTPSRHGGGDGAGHGLVGIRQRAAMYGGTVTAGPRGDRPGWIVDVALEAVQEA